MGTQLPASKGHRLSQIFGHVCCGQTAGWIKMQLGREVGLGPGHTVLDGEPAAPPPNGHSPPPIFGQPCCGKTAGWIKMPLGREVGLGPGHIVLDGDPTPISPNGHSPPIFGPCLLWRNSWMDQDATWQRDRPRPKQHCVRWGPSPPFPKGLNPPRFLANVCCGQTAEWIKVPLGTKVCLGPGRIVTWGTSAPSQ